jgi:hypothetical protein
VRRELFRATVRRNAVIDESMDALVWLRKQLETLATICFARWCAASRRADVGPRPT